MAENILTSWDYPGVSLLNFFVLLCFPVKINIQIEIALSIAWVEDPFFAKQENQ